VDLVFLHGPAAAGKPTTARALEERTGLPVFHNHLVVDLLTTVFPFGSEPFVRLREDFWTSVFADAARAGRSITFTFARSDRTKGNLVPDAYLAALAVEAGCEWITADRDFGRFPDLRWTLVDLR
jgi:hypothetical protein